MRQALSGAADAGFSTTVLPQISAGASFQAGMALGKFHGVTRPTTPMGLRMANMWTRSRSEGTNSAGHARAFAGEIAKDIDGAAHFALGFGKGFAFFARHVGGDGIELAVEHVGGFVENIAARGASRGGPCRQRGGRGIGGVDDVLRRAFGK